MAYQKAKKLAKKSHELVIDQYAKYSSTFGIKGSKGWGRLTLAKIAPDLIGSLPWLTLFYASWKETGRPHWEYMTLVWPVIFGYFGVLGGYAASKFIEKTETFKESYEKYEKIQTRKKTWKRQILNERWGEKSDKNFIDFMTGCMIYPENKIYADILIQRNEAYLDA